MPSRRGRSVDFGHGIAATGSAGLVEAGGVLAEPVGADERISPARPGIFWRGVPVRGWGVARGLGGGGRDDRGKGERNEDNGDKVLCHMNLDLDDEEADALSQCYMISSIATATRSHPAKKICEAIRKAVPVGSSPRSLLRAAASDRSGGRLGG
jgi:hypothetical protein